MVCKTKYFTSINKILLSNFYFAFKGFLFFLPSLQQIQQLRMNSEEEKDLFKKITKNDEAAFETLFHKYYGHLCLFAAKIIQDNESAEEIVQGFFVKLWEKRNELTIDTSVSSYFFRSIRNLCINYINHSKIKNEHAQKVLQDNNRNVSFDNYYREVNLAEKIEESINSLPEKRKQIFLLSREKGLKYREIAEKLNISIKTVEAQMGLAIKTLREKLKDYSSLFILFCTFLKS